MYIEIATPPLREARNDNSAAVIARSIATKQSQKDCHASLAGSLAMTATLHCHCKERSEEAISWRLPRVTYRSLRIYGYKLLIRYEYSSLL